MKSRPLKDALGWGIGLWLLGYVMGIILFFVLPTSLIGWVIMPIGVAATTGVLLKKVKGDTLKDYLVLAVAWTLIAVGFDYVFIVQALQPEDGYYKLDVYLYYALTFLIPLALGRWKLAARNQRRA